MTARRGDSPRAPAEAGGRPWRIGLAAGATLFAFGLAGLLADARQTVPADWLTWALASLVLHDLVLVPVVLAAGLALTRLLPAALRGGVQATLAVCGAVALVSVPVVLAEGRRADNPSLLPHDYGRNLAIVLGVILVGGILVTLVRLRVRRVSRSGDGASVQ
ncbi:MAG: hypothetical protein ACLGI5_10605 [Thermoleophilia bacterium]